MKYARLYATPDGSSHFEDVEIELPEVDHVPSAPPLGLAEFSTARQCSFMQAAAGWQSDWHLSAARNLFAVISGEWEVIAADGTIRRFVSGDLLVVEDTTGKGHQSRVISDSLALVVELTDKRI
jgi:hypothetical protein